MKQVNLKLLMQKIIPSALVAILGIAAFISIRGNAIQKEMPRVEIDGKIVEIELAETTEEKIQGLSGRSSLAEGTGMLFLFEEKDRLGFWMKDMQFDLDFIWIADNKIVDAHRNVPAPDPNTVQLDVYSPSVPADKILEVNAGWIEKNFGDQDIRGKEIKLFIE